MLLCCYGKGWLMIQYSVSLNLAHSGHIEPTVVLAPPQARSFQLFVMQLHTHAISSTIPFRSISVTWMMLR